MILSLAALCAVALLLATLVLAGGSLVRRPTDVVLIYLLVYGQFYVLRPVIFALGLDSPFPDVQFSALGEAPVLLKTALGLNLYLAIALLFLWLVRSSGIKGFGPFATSPTIDLRRTFLVTGAFTFVASLVSAYFLARYGSFGGVVTAAKVDKALAGLFLLRAVPALGAVVAVGAFLESRAQGTRWWVSAAALGMAVLNAAYIFMWGSRSLLVVIVAALVLGARSKATRRLREDDTPAAPTLAPALDRPRPPSPSPQFGTVLLRLTAASLLVLAVAGGLRIVRDTLLTGDVQPVYAEANLARQASLGVNAVYFDAAMLAFRDWPDTYPYRGGQDFVAALYWPVPRVLWEDKPSAIAPGVWFRQRYEPLKINGWPMGAGALWYLNFGWLGLALGGALTGSMVGVISAAQLRRPDNGLNAAIAVATGVYVVGLGVDSDILVRAILWLVPLWAIARFVTVHERPEPPPARESVGAMPAAD